MADSLGSFTLDLTRFGELTQLRANTVLRKVGLDLLGSVVAGIPYGTGTPVDTGRARGGWMVQLDSVPEGEPGRLDKVGAETIAAGQAEIAQATTENEICLANNVPYIVELEYGHSKQAPYGMVRTSLAAFPGIVQKAVVESGGTP